GEALGCFAVSLSVYRCSRIWVVGAHSAGDLLAGEEKMRAWLDDLRTRFSRPTRTRMRPRFLKLERLEDRCLLTAPIWSGLNADVGSIPEGGGTVNISGSFMDPDAGETYAITINWDDGTPLQTVSLGSSKSFTNVPHNYDASVPPGLKLIDVTAIDSNLEHSERSVFFFIDNVAPVPGSVTVTPAAVSQSNLVALTSNLTSIQEVPPQSTTATGTATAAVNLSTGHLDLSVLVQGLGPGDTVTAAELHAGAAGTNGPTLVTLDASGFVTVGSGSERLTQMDLTFPSANIPDLLAGNVYLNVHTSAQP